MTGRRTADWVLFGVTLALLAPCVAVAGNCAHELGRDGPSDEQTRNLLLSETALWVGSALVWSAVAWCCSGPVPRGLALVAALGYSVAVAVVVACSFGPAWVRAAVLGARWAEAAFSVVDKAGWLPAIPILAFARRWGDPPRA